MLLGINGRLSKCTNIVHSVFETATVQQNGWWFVRSFIRLLVRSLSFDAFIPHQSNLAVRDAVTNTVCSPKVGTVSGRVWMMTWDGGGAGVGNTEDDSSPGVLYSEA